MAMTLYTHMRVLSAVLPKLTDDKMAAECSRGWGNRQGTRASGRDD